MIHESVILSIEYSIEEKQQHFIHLSDLFLSSVYDILARKVFNMLFFFRSREKPNQI